MKAIKWLLSIFEDQNGGASHKRFIVTIFVYFFWLLVVGSLEGKPVDQNVLFTTAAVILWGIGAIASEFIAKTWSSRNGK